MNRVILLGRLVDEPVMTKSGELSIARLRLAVDRKTKGEADYISCVAFGKTADNIGRFFHKGSRFACEGHIQTGSYTNKDGRKIYTTDVVIEGFDFVENKTEEKPKPEPKQTSFMDLADEGLPFPS